MKNEKAAVLALACLARIEGVASMYTGSPLFAVLHAATLALSFEFVVKLYRLEYPYAFQ
jgi:hypothetical protein